MQCKIHPYLDKKCINVELGINWRYSVYDIYGKQVLSGILQGSNNIISTASLVPGSYLIKIYSGQRVISQKIEI